MSSTVVTAAATEDLRKPISDTEQLSENIKQRTSVVDNERGAEDDESNGEDNVARALLPVPCELPRKLVSKSEIPRRPSPSSVREDLAAKSNSRTLKRQVSAESPSEDAATRKKPRRKVNKKPRVAESKIEPKALNTSHHFSHANVAPDLKLVFGFEHGPQDKQRALLFTSGKDIHKLRASITLARNNAKILKLIKPADNIPLPHFGDKVYTVPDMPKKLEMIKHHPHLAIRALEQGLFDWIFHAMPVFMDNARGNPVLVKYRCGLVDCSWRSETTYKGELMGHFRHGCKILKELEAKIGKANEISESEEES